MTDSFHIGPFTVDDHIADGGMGTVYRGTHRKTGVSVALKCIGGVPDPQVRRQFHREVQAHARLLHPGIVYLFEYGEVDATEAGDSDGTLTEGSPYVAMELAERGTVRDLLPVASWKTACRLLIQILDSLAYAHARDVVHRDLKPENLLYFEPEASPYGGSRVKLTDFGIAHAFGRHGESARDAPAPTVGTALYMSPEQPGEYGPWTDLYALGTVAWELVCGRPPFQVDSASAIARKHRTEARPPLDPQFPVPDQLETWIHRAMAIDPDRRFCRAADAAWALPREVLTDERSRPTAPSSRDPRETVHDLPADGGDREVDTDTAPIWRPRPVTLGASDFSDDATPRPDAQIDGEARSHPPLPADWRPEQTEALPAPLVGTGLGLFGLREPPFVDRREESDRIWRCLERVVDRETLELVFVTGETGVGKSRLAEWMAIRAHEVGAANLLRAVHTLGGSSPDGLAGAFERTFQTVDRDRGEVYQHLLETLPAIDGEDDELRRRDARAITEFLRPTDDSEDVDGPGYRFSSDRHRRALVVRTLERLADRRPLVVWLDDLQWGSETLGVLEHLCASNDDPPALLVIATLRSDVLPAGSQFAERLEAVDQECESTRIALDPLPRPYQRELLEGLLPLEDDLADRVAEQTEGHPLFAMQLLGHWIDGGELEVGPDGFRLTHDSDVPLPETIHQLWVDRIDRLVDAFPEQTGTTILESLERAAALGREIDEHEWEFVIDPGPVPPDRLVDQLVERGLAERTTEGWAFTHGLVVASLAHRAREAGRWRDHHRRCAETLQTLLTGDAPGHRERIAEHWIEAGEPQRALALLLEEIDLRANRGEDDERDRLLRRRGRLIDDLQLPDDHPRRLEQHVERGEMAANAGELKRARTLFSDVWETSDGEAPQLESRAAKGLTFVERNLGNRERGQDWGRKALEAARRAGDERLRGRCHRRIGWFLCSEGDLDQADAHVERALDFATSAGDRYGELQALRLQAYIRETAGDPRAGELFESVRRCASEAGYVIVEAQTLNGLGAHMQFAGRLDRARQYYRQYMKKMKELSRPAGQSVVQLNLAQVELRAERFDRALDYLRSAIHTRKTIGAEDSWEDLRHLIRLALAAGRGDEAEFQCLWEPLEQTWPEAWRMEKDYPWLLETAGMFADEAGWDEKAVALYRLARTLWDQLGDDDAVDALDRRLSDR